MVENRFLFYFSGFLSISLFSFFLVVFIYMMFSPQKVKQFALIKDNYISISIEMPQEEIKSSKKSVITPVKEIQKSAPQVKNIDVANLFNNVWTKDIKKKVIKKKKVNNKLLKEIQKKISTSKPNETNDILKKANMVSDNDEKESHKSTSTDVNEYLARIQGLVYSYFNPPQNSQGHSVKAVIKLSSIGKVLDFRILNYSANSSLNEECDLIKERLMSVIFPVNPENKSVNYIIILTSKE